MSWNIKLVNGKLKVSANTFPVPLDQSLIKCIP